jgi:hypothetical protein
MAEAHHHRRPPVSPAAGDLPPANTDEHAATGAGIGPPANDDDIARLDGLADQ